MNSAYGFFLQSVYKIVFIKYIHPKKFIIQ